jgi:ring-1,2-phenylacetyl-CoA epoxidase subunit PaaD
VTTGTHALAAMPATAASRSTARRSTATQPAASITADDVRDALRAVTDPEIPTVSIVDLGLVHDIQVTPDAILVELLPTWVACPATEMIRANVTDVIDRLGLPAAVEFVRTVPWTTDRLTDAGRDGLRRAGIAPPGEPDEIDCPYCRSGAVAMDSAFGPALCRSLFYCRSCRQPFEAFKPV